MEARDIERYLAELGAELKQRGIKQPIRILIIGGAYMLLHEHAARTTGQAPRHRMPGLVKHPRQARGGQQA